MPEPEQIGIESESDRYRLDQVVGQGGTGVVYKAYDTLLRRPVAIKLLHRALSEDESLVRRLKREIRITSQLSHPGIVRTFDMVDIRGAKGIAMALIEGEDLARVIARRSRLSVPEAVRTGIAICSALRAAHGAGVIHRDVKPQNILVSRTGELFITDFGFARCLADDGSHVTRATECVGTPRYASPEQIRGQVVDQRADIYSLGAVLYELLAGQPPFSDLEKLDVQGRDLKAKDPSHLNPEIPRQLSEVILKCLEYLPADRFQTADDLIAALFRCVQQRPAGFRLWLERARLARRFFSYALASAILVIVSLAAARYGTTAWRMVQESAGRYISRWHPAPGTTADAGQRMLVWSTGTSRITVVANGAETVLTDVGLTAWTLPGRGLITYSEWNDDSNSSQRLTLFDAGRGERKVIFKGPYFIQNVLPTTSVEGEPVLVMTVVRCTGGLRGIIAITLDGDTLFSIEPADLVAMQRAQLTAARYASAEAVARARPNTVKTFSIQAKKRPR